MSKKPEQIENEDDENEGLELSPEWLQNLESKFDDKITRLEELITGNQNPTKQPPNNTNKTPLEGTQITLTLKELKELITNPASMLSTPNPPPSELEDDEADPPARKTDPKKVKRKRVFLKNPE